MRIAIINGSPRGMKSNRRLMTDQFLEGFREGNPAAAYEMYYLVNRHQIQDAIDCCLQSDVVLIAFPLYTDAMPGIVKMFFEKVPLLPGKKIAFFVQSGFPEAIHCFYLEKYLEKFAHRLGAEYLGTVTKGNVEGIQERPAWMNKGLFSSFRSLGLHFAQTGELDKKIVSKLKKPFKFPAASQVFFRLISLTGIFNSGWNHLLKANHAYEVRHARPYEVV
jgi:NAD(P)H-dependent FMN reductase